MTQAPLSSRFNDALVFAATLHAHQWRKASTVPYVAHVLAVTAIVLEAGGDEDEAIAALLHDTVEDCGGAKTAEQIREQFGVRVTEIVLGCSDTDQSPKPPWRERKERYLAHLPSATPSVWLVSAADKLHNLRCLITEHARLGEQVWDYFRAGREGTRWYYRELINIFRATPLSRELLGLLEIEFAALETQLSHG